MNIQSNPKSLHLLVVFFLLIGYYNNALAQNSIEDKPMLYGTTNTFIYLNTNTAILEILVIDKPNYFINLDTLVRQPNGDYKGRNTNINKVEDYYSIIEMPAIPNFKRKSKLPKKLSKADEDLTARYKKYKDSPFTKLYDHTDIQR